MLTLNKTGAKNSKRNAIILMLRWTNLIDKNALFYLKKNEVSEVSAQ